MEATVDKMESVEFSYEEFMRFRTFSDHRYLQAKFGSFFDDRRDFMVMYLIEPKGNGKRTYTAYASIKIMRNPEGSIIYEVVRLKGREKVVIVETFDHAIAIIGTWF